MDLILHLRPWILAAGDHFEGLVLAAAALVTFAVLPSLLRMRLGLMVWLTWAVGNVAIVLDGPLLLDGVTDTWRLWALMASLAAGSILGLNGSVLKRRLGERTAREP